MTFVSYGDYYTKFGQGIQILSANFYFLIKFIKYCPYTLCDSAFDNL